MRSADAKACAVNIGARCNTRPPGSTFVRGAPLCIFGRKGQKTQGWNGGGREKEEGERSVHFAKNRCILCSDPSRSLSCNAVPSGRTVGRERPRKRSIRQLVSLSFCFFFLLSVSFFFTYAIVRSIPLVRVFDYECLVLRHRARATFASRLPFRTEGIDNFFDAFPKRIAFHTFLNSGDINAYDTMNTII